MSEANNMYMVGWVGLLQNIFCLSFKNGYLYFVFFKIKIILLIQTSNILMETLNQNH